MYVNGTFGMNDEFGELHIMGPMGMDIKPTITCSHCNNIVVLNPGRVRERTRCLKCMKFVCDPCCGSECVPINEIAADHFEGPMGKRASDILNSVGDRPILL
jgi:hypothetical protein